ncbi:hypothetical protein QFW96_13055 [Saccharopolyspora sp. TS4A08]|uniref:NTP pyrophosphohydrolase MazG putative catalytic core domain-containing protein n=1 Tax=Saccharopolyspora ipomoeae TaxID=3042027 RepID=A0ABT6PNF9_9PSEU|nr:hypothetical protein [Saccharopolyspora sp. TS4A08]MDI2029552.1 hypothetical protein [Saccharopolyspora sp. TS4A08]
MSTPVEHPLEGLYQVRDVLEAAVAGVQRQEPERVGDQLGCYAAVNTSILYEFRALADLLREKISDSKRPAVRVAHEELGDVVDLFDVIIAYVDRHQPTINELRHQDMREAGG